MEYPLDLKKEDFEFTFESQGTSFFFESIVNEFYDPPGTVTIAQNNTKRAFNSKKTLQKMSRDGEILTPEKLNSVAASLGHIIAQTKKEAAEFAAKKDFSKEDTVHMIELLGSFCKHYFFFDMAMWDSTYVVSKVDPKALEKVNIVEAFKNNIRADADPVFFTPDGYLLTLIAKVSEHSGVSKERLQYYRRDELVELFDGKQVSDSEIENRKQAYTYITTDDGARIFYSGQESLDFAEVFLGAEGKVAEDNITGRVAHGLGKKVTGRVCIIIRNYDNPEATRKNMHAMGKGDVLVSSTTDPELMEAFKKASAVVTDVGGMLSHAAITARELDIPCIVSTGNASKILKNGDLVEVNAERGVVKIIERA